MKKTQKLIIQTLVLTAPLFASAFNMVEVIGKVEAVVSLAIPVLLGILSIFFLWNVIQFIKSAGGDDKEKAREMIIYSVVGMFIAVAVWGLVAALTAFFGVSGGAIPSDLKFPGQV